LADPREAAIDFFFFFLSATKTEGDQVDSPQNSERVDQEIKMQISQKMPQCSK
jgi:hypothetical protein